MLFDPASHERLVDRPWSESHASAAIAAIVADVESAFDEHALWPAHPRDDDLGPLPPLASLYLGASGVVWALDELERLGAAELRRSWAPAAVTLHERYLTESDFVAHLGGPVPSLWMANRGSCSSRTGLRPPTGRKSGCSRASGRTSPTRAGS